MTVFLEIKTEINLHVGPKLNKTSTCIILELEEHFPYSKASWIVKGWECAPKLANNNWK